ncbi:Flavin-dependent halogenase armH1 [Psilocybe cubensis]|uniref:Flavin-dependent halogenase armH1 n=1 Tax=Psilocybe cubensis TaxID=181762 RepID=A0ACB8HAX8_PSICU|nr:Flavin-dependent halogenase armH1 [Psilocybe cubensis]KAH9485155.1 Flavin-dependent halogenase armH1 [Psilocybe cubensis]
MSSAPPSSLPPQVLIVGGGPAGSYAAAALAREGIQPGSAIKFNQFKREGYTDFVALGHNNNAWNVVRSEFDQMLLNHARSTGASVYEQTKVESISFSSTDPSRPVSVSWTHTPPPAPPSPPASPTSSTFSGFFPSDFSVKNFTASGPSHGKTSFTYLIDATGRAGILSTRYFKNRHFNVSLKNIAVWGYWQNTGHYGVGSRRQGAPWFEALTDESGWAWFIPLHNGTTSVGVVMNEKMYKAKLQEPLPPSPFAATATVNPSSESALVMRYLSNLSLTPGVVNLITTSGKLINGSVKSASDFSYSAPSYAGPGYRIVGDAGAFIDPFFSSGVHLAMTSALSAAATICASIRGHCLETTAAEWHTRRVSTSYTRFQVVVLSAYKQIRSQSDDILSDIDEDNYDRAFSFLRPVIQGASDMGARLSETELQRSLDFCVNLFNPTTPEQHERLAHCGDIGKELLDVASPVVDPSVFEDTLCVGRALDNSLDDPANSSDVERATETKMILNKINARRVVHPEYAINNLETEPLSGYVVKLERGKLGLIMAPR